MWYPAAPPGFTRVAGRRGHGACECAAAFRGPVGAPDTLSTGIPMTLRRLIPAIAALALSTAAQAQDTPVGQRPYRFTVEGYLSQARFDGATVGRGERNLGGYGARVMFNRSTPAATVRSFFNRASVGAFATFTSSQGALDASTTHIGAETDVSLFPTPIFRGTLDPFVSVGAGLLRSAHDVSVGGARLTNNDFAFTPGLGTRLGFPGGFGFRGDLRAPIVFGNSTSINPVAEGGVYLSF